MMAEAGYSTDWAHDLKAEREERLRRITDRIEGAAYGHAVVGTPVEELVALSERVGLVVVGSRAWGPLRRVLVGSTAAGLTRRAACPVIVLPRGAVAAQGDEAATAGSSSGG
jgi:nucleotide-binding universal stress UspA family protein